MKIVGCDLHARQQTIATMDTENGRSLTLDPDQEQDEKDESLHCACTRMG